MIVGRREALARLVAMTGASVIGAEFWVTGCARSDKAAVPFSAAEIALMDEIGETIIPETDTPGARAAGVGPFMAMMVNDCYDAASHAIFRGGLAKVDASARQRFDRPFVECTAEDRTALLNELDREQLKYTQRKGADDAPHYFRLMKDLTLLGYFLSEIGSTKALRYVESPGSYDGDVPYRKGDRAWVNPTHRTT